MIQLAAIDSQSFEDFASKHGPSLDCELNDWVELITALPPTKQNFERLNTLAWFIFVERQGVSFGEPFRFRVSPQLSRFQTFIYSLNAFMTMNVPYEKWSSMVDMLFNVLSTQSRSQSLDTQTVDCQNVCKHAAEIMHRLNDDPVFQQTYTDFLNGAL